MFRGRFELSIDEKGRINIPSKFRDVLKGKDDGRLIITNDFDKCLVAYPYNEWLELEEKTGRLSMVSREAKTFQRFFISGATECTFDKQGRVLIPPVLREHAGLEKEIVVAGMVKKIEIWSKSQWEMELSQSIENFDENFESMSKVLSDLGI